MEPLGRRAKNSRKPVEQSPTSDPRDSRAGLEPSQIRKRLLVAFPILETLTLSEVLLSRHGCLDKLD